MPVFEKEGRRVLFVHIPKTGGTTLEDVLVANGYEMSFRRGGRFGPLLPEDIARGCSPQHLHGAALSQVFDPQEFDYCFTLVRHPTARLVSEYKFRRFIAGEDGIAPIQMWMKDAEELYRANPYALDNHLRPQEEFLWPEGCAVFSLEAGFEQILSDLSPHLGNMTYKSEHQIAMQDKDQPVLMGLADPVARRLYQGDFKRFGYDRGAQ